MPPVWLRGGYQQPARAITLMSMALAIWGAPLKSLPIWASDRGGGNFSHLQIDVPNDQWRGGSLKNLGRPRQGPAGHFTRNSAGLNRGAIGLRW
jgi:hypothetical protein